MKISGNLNYKPHDLAKLPNITCIAFVTPRLAIRKCFLKYISGKCIEISFINICAAVHFLEYSRLDVCNYSKTELHCACSCRNSLHIFRTHILKSTYRCHEKIGVTKRPISVSHHPQIHSSDEFDSF